MRLAAATGPVAFGVLSVLVLCAAPAHAVCNATRLCEPTDDPCIVSAACTIPAGATFDVRPRALIVRRPLVVGTGTALTTIRAGSILVEPEGDVTANGTSGGGSIGGSFRLEATTTIETRSQGNTRSRLRADAGLYGGSISLMAGGDVTLASTISVAASNNLGIGGTFEAFSTGGSIRLSDNGGGTTLKATGGNSADGSGGTIDVYAHQSVLIDGEIDASNGSSFAEVAIEATYGTLTTTARGLIKVNASVVGDAGIVELAAGDDVIVGGNVEAKGAGGGGEDGEGGYGGVVLVSGADVLLSASTIDLRGAAPDGDGGELEVEALGDLTVDALILVSVGGYGSGGEVSLFAEGDVDLAKRIDASGGDTGGVIGVAATGDVVVRNQLLARGDYDGGDVELQGCGVRVAAGALVSTTAAPQPFPQRGRNLLTASGQLTVEGTLTSAGSNLLDYRELPPIVTGSVVPAPVIRAMPGLPCCGGCPASTTSTSTTSSTTTSSTSSSSSTSTSSSTTSSSASSSTSTSASSTSSSTSTSATSTSLPPSTTTSVTSSSTSTSTTTLASSTTSTTIPGECPDAVPATVAGAICRIELVAGELGARTDAQVGGRKQKRRLLGRIGRASTQAVTAGRLVDEGKPVRKVVARLRRAAALLRAFEARVGKGVERGTIAAADGERWLELARTAHAALEVVRAAVSGRAAR